MSRYFTVEWKIEVLFRNGTTDVTHGIFAGPKSVPEKHHRWQCSTTRRRFLRYRPAPGLSFLSARTLKKIIFRLTAIIKGIIT
jgi:hypothetical protein